MFTLSARRARFAALAFSTLTGTLMAGGVTHAQTPPKPVATPQINPSVVKRVVPPAPKLPANVIATVNGKSITREDLLGLFEMVHGKPLVSELIKDTVLEDKAKSLGVVVTDTELNAAIAATKERIVQSQMQRGAPMTYEQFALEQGITPTFLRWSVYQDTLRKNTFLKDAQKSMPTLANQIKVEHILIATIPLGGEQPQKPATDAEQAKTDADAKVKIDGILADIKAGKITFEDAAKKYSADQSNANEGGLLPYAPRGTFDEAFENAAWNLKTKGEVSPPVKSKFGWHLIKLVSRGSDATPEEVKAFNADEMQRLAQQADNPQAIQGWISSLIQNAKVVVNPSPVIVANAKLPVINTHAPTKKTASK